MSMILASASQPTEVVLPSDFLPCKVQMHFPRFACIDLPNRRQQSYWAAAINRGFEKGFMVVGDQNTPNAPRAVFKIKSVHSSISHLDIHEIMRRSSDRFTAQEAAAQYAYYQKQLPDSIVYLEFYYGIVFHEQTGRWIKAEVAGEQLVLDARMSPLRRDSKSFPVGHYGNWPIKFLHRIEYSGYQYKQIAELIWKVNQNLSGEDRINEYLECCASPANLINYQVLPWAIS